MKRVLYNFQKDFWMGLGVAALGVVLSLVVDFGPKPVGHRDTRPVHGTVECEIAKSVHLAGPITFERRAHYTAAEKVKNVCRGGKP